jgi:hypothetical protein
MTAKELFWDLAAELQEENSLPARRRGVSGARRLQGIWARGELAARTSGGADRARNQDSPLRRRRRSSSNGCLCPPWIEKPGDLCCVRAWSTWGPDVPLSPNAHCFVHEAQSFHEPVTD